MALDLGNPIERNLTAGEYVLGTLAADERETVEDAARGNVVLKLEIARWERQLSGLGLRLAPLAPRPTVWLDLAHRAGLGGERRGRPLLWQAWAVLATAASLALAFVLYREAGRPVPQPVVERVEVPVAAASLVAVLPVPQSTMVWSVSLTPERKTLSVRAQGQMPAAGAGKDAQLWWIAEAGPVSLGVIPTVGEMRGTLPPGTHYVRGGTLAVSLEPPGGSPNPDGPTGPVVTTAQVLQAG